MHPGSNTEGHQRHAAGEHRARRRRTPQRAAIEQLILSAPGPLTITEIHEQALRMQRGFGIATVYRAVSALERDGTVRRIVLPADSPRYEPAALSRHHYFRCNGCQRVYWVFGSFPEVAGMLPDGFVKESHEVYLYGSCSGCGG